MFFLQPQQSGDAAAHRQFQHFVLTQNAQAEYGGKIGHHRQAHRDHHGDQVAVEQLNAAKYNIKSAEAALEEAKESLRKTTIYAPMTGIVSMLMVEKGERVVGTSQMAGTEMLRIANLNEMEVLVDVNENDIIRLNLKDTAYIEVDAYPNRKFKGVVTQIANSAKNSFRRP